jgi:methylenetetrahydrofolate dehydrogenase (NADP+)/methenyltetrahydrofolate cyclohydrolase
LDLCRPNCKNLGFVLGGKDMLLNGKAVVDKIKEDILQTVNECRIAGKNLPRLTILRVGERTDDIAYEKRILKNCNLVGIEAEVVNVDKNIKMVSFMDVLERLNNDTNIHGILIFRPLPKQLDIEQISKAINPEKDIDCMSPV